MSSKQSTFQAIGTSWHISYHKDISDTKLHTLEKHILHQIEQFDKTYSRFREDSWIYTLAKKKGIYDLPHDALPILDLYKDLYELTDGAFTPLIGQTLVDAGYDAQYSLRAADYLEIPAAWEETFEYNTTTITMKKPALLDFGAGGKGYLVDILGWVLEKEHVRSYTINAGGDILHKSATHTKIRVGLEHPGNNQQVIGIVPLVNRSMCASAGNRRAWGDYHHLINAKTALPSETILAAWVIADSALLADSLATALFFTSVSTLQKKYDFEYLILDEQLHPETSPHFDGELFFSEK